MFALDHTHTRPFSPYGQNCMPDWCLDQPQFSQGLGAQDQPPLQRPRPTPAADTASSCRPTPLQSLWLQTGQILGFVEFCGEGGQG